MGNRRPSISVFFPAYNDAQSIGALVTKILALLPTLTDDFEVIVVNDGSTDNTGAVLKELARANSCLRIIQHEKNRGYGGALRSGFSNAKKELVFYTDGDGQYDVGELVLLLPLLTPQIDVVNGYKARRADGAGRRVLGGVYNCLAHLLFSIPIRDVDCDFRLLRRSALDRIELTANGGSICVELIHKLHRAGCSFAEVPVSHYERTSGRSQFFKAGPMIRMARDLFSYWFRLVVRPWFKRSGRIARSSQSTLPRSTGQPW